MTADVAGVQIARVLRRGGEAVGWAAHRPEVRDEMSTKEMTTSEATLEDDRAVRAVLDGVYDAWALNDPDAFVAGYAEGATAIHTGAFMPSRAAIREVMAAVFLGPLEGSRGEHEVQEVRFVGADTAIVISRGSVVMAGQTSAAPESRTLDSWVLSRLGGTWRVEAFHNCHESAA
jgi:uncharacterized protein (TIGR02246 family)